MLINKKSSFTPIYGILIKDVRCYMSLLPAIGKNLKKPSSLTIILWRFIFLWKAKGGKRIDVDLIYRNESLSKFVTFVRRRKNQVRMWPHMKIRNSNMEINLTNDFPYEHDRSIKLLNLNAVEGLKSDSL